MGVFGLGWRGGALWHPEPLQEENLRNPLISRRRTAALVVTALTAGLAISACGDDEDDTETASQPKKLAMEVIQQGKNKFSLAAPKSVEAGLVEMTLKTPAARGATHDAQLVRV